MVSLDDSGQLFTIEGLTAALLMVATAYIVLGTGMVLTPGDVHISDMQLKQMGDDALLVMDTKNSADETSQLETLVKNMSAGGATAAAAKEQFGLRLKELLKKGTGATYIVDSISYSSKIYYRNGDIIESDDFSDPVISSDNPAKRPAIRCGRYVNTEYKGSDRVVRVEVLLWRE
ncbi:hypothetical protein F1737_08515 [Methanoplanus sp. FWC-SCC4]|uniref:Uncharacterized protein n=1 Tax=Methanochimaera problematica TaxID=2609417 RepID=A0AA97FEF9_9EURY|nr:hypothetical protein [Methanoplanus sp. FWC-SCC4]WOF16729.1 hypothetical protein F1737_08515 [Methanoplanus sp. FWC-SCC4]